MVVQIICNTKSDFPKAGEHFLFDSKSYKVQAVSIAFKMRKHYFVNVLL